ncbi:MAG: transcriptional repressor NrdR [Clostridia bacterium]|nr:transcriptional repressor NrdR [Clostridia bacterium]
MKCLFCGYEDSKVLDSRDTNNSQSIRRRRECLNCGKRFTTYETIETVPVLIIKSDHSRQPFDNAKLKKSIMIACDKRPVSLEMINELTDEIEKEVFNAKEQEIYSSTIGQMVLKKLKRLDDLACIRYAIVFKKFESIEDLETFITSIKSL